MVRCVVLDRIDEYIYRAVTLGCLFVDTETHENGVIKRTTGNAWSAFNLHHSSVFQCQLSYQVFLLLSHMLSEKCKKIFKFSISYCGFSCAFLSCGLIKLGESNLYYLCPICMKWSLWLHTKRSLWLYHCDVINWDKQSFVIMTVDL